MKQLGSGGGVMRYQDLEYQMKSHKIGPNQAVRAIESMRKKGLVYISGAGNHRIVVNLSPAAQKWFR